MLSNIIAKILAGTVVGYATNYLAIKMLFQEFFKVKIGKKKWSLGGVIIKEREQFQKSISRLVESDVIHHHALKTEINKDSFLNSIEKIFSHFLEVEVGESQTGKIELRQISGLSQSIEKIRQNLKIELEKPLKNIYAQVLKNQPLDKVLSTEQVRHLSKNLATELTIFLEKNMQWESLITEILENIAEKPLADFLPEPVGLQLASNLADLLKDLHASLQYNYADTLEDILKTAEKELNLSEIFEDLSKRLSTQPISSFLTQENIENLPLVLREKIQDLFKDDIKEDIIVILLKYLLNVLGEEKTKLMDLLSPKLQESLVNFLKNNIPDVLNTLKPWIKSRREKLEDLVQDAFEKEASGFVKLLATIFIGNIGEYVGVEERLIEQIEKQNPDELAENFTEKIIQFLEKNTIQDVIQKIKIENIIKILAPVLQKDIQEALKKIDFSKVTIWLDKPLNTWFSAEILTKELGKIWQEVKQKYLIQNFLFNEKFTNWTQNQIKTHLFSILKNELKNILNEEKIKRISQNISNSIRKKVVESQDFFEKVLKELIEKHITSKNLGQVLPPQTENNQLIPFILQAIDMFLMMQWQKYEKQNIASLLPTFINENTAKNLATFVQNYLDKNIETLTKGQIENLVQKSLSKQGDIQLRGLVYKAMGKELEPLSMFGGILGAITGALLLLIPEYQQVGVMLAVSGVAYGVTGWGTNWLAIKMLFKPYQAWKFPFFKKRVPFTPGVLAKNKGRFAKSMGRFIGDNLLNSQSLKDNFEQNKTILKEKLKEMVSKEDFKWIENLLKNNQNKMGDWLVENLEKTLFNPAIVEMQVKNQIEKNKNYSLATLKTENIEELAKNYFASDERNTQIQDFTASRIEKFTQNTQFFKEIFPDTWLARIQPALAEWLAKEIPTITYFFETEKVWKMLDNPSLIQTLDNVLNKNLESLLNDEQEEAFKNQVFNFIFKQLDNPQLRKQIITFFESYLKNEFAQQKTLEELNNGKILNLLQENMPEILNNIIQLGIENLQENKEQIIIKIFEDIKKENSFATFLAGNSIKNTLNELLGVSVPNFLREEQKELTQRMQLKINELGKKRLHFSTEDLLKKETLEQRLTTIFENQGLRNKVRQLTNIILTDKIFKIPFNHLLKDDIQDILQHLKIVLTPALNEILDHLKEHLQNHENTEKIAQPLAKLATEIAEKHILNTQISVILHQISPQEIQKIAQNLTNAVIENQTFHHTKTQFVQTIFERLKKYELGQLLNIDILKNDLSQTINEMLKNPNTKILISQMIKHIIETQLGGLNNHLSPETKDFLLSNITESFLNATQIHLLEVLVALDFKGIVEREIQAMKPEQLEGLFYGFAEKYFVYLIGYGFIFGILFGWIIDFGILGIGKIVK
jgi:uncharacterized membrane protein YheB (UPF0754 family)